VAANDQQVVAWSEIPSGEVAATAVAQKFRAMATIASGSRAKSVLAAQSKDIEASGGSITTDRVE
jgi:hypothetical protein